MRWLQRQWTRIVMWAVSLPRPRRLCPACHNATSARWLEAVRPLTPRLHRNESDLIHTAAIYADLKHSEGWRDFWGRVEAARTEVVERLLKGVYRGTGDTQASDDELRAMLFALNLVMGIPISAEDEFEQWKAARAQRRRLAHRMGVDIPLTEEDREGLAQGATPTNGTHQ